jgi:hypothetical protein
VKCRKCGARASIELRRHNAAFCAPDFLEFFRKQVREAIRKHTMFTTDEPVLVAVSGGKDSLALWRLLARVESEVREVRGGARRAADHLDGGGRGRGARPYH